MVESCGSFSTEGGTEPDSRLLLTSLHCKITMAAKSFPNGDGGRHSRPFNRMSESQTANPQELSSFKGRLKVRGERKTTKLAKLRA